MENFNDFMADDIQVVDEDALSEAMWDFIASLNDDVLDELDENQLGEYVEIIEAVASDEDGLEEGYSDDDWVVVYQRKAVQYIKNPKNDKAPQGKIKSSKYDDIMRISKAKKDGIEVKESEDIDIDEAMPAKKVRRDIIKKRAASREHRKVKAKRKLEGKRKRKTAQFKRFKKKSKRLGKRGLTSTGKRKRTYINKG